MFVLLLSVLIIFLCLYGTLPVIAVAVLALTPAAIGIIFRIIHHGHKHDHGDMLTMVDFYAVRSKLGSVNAGLKAVFFFGVMLSVLAVGKWMYAAFVCVTMCIIVTVLGRTPFKVWLRLLAVPVAFILVSSVVLLLDFSSEASGILNIPFFGKWIVLTEKAQAEAQLLIVRCVAAICCLYALSLTTPIFELTEAMRRIHVPKLIIELMFLIYRYIFVLSSMLNELKTAAECRMGYNGFKSGFRTASGLLLSLLAGSLRRASASFDAMESRCYDGTLRFYHEEKPVIAVHTVSFAAYCSVLIVIAVLERKFL